MEEKIINKMCKKVIGALLITILAIMVCLICISTAETLVLAVNAAYLFTTYLNLKGKNMEQKEIKGLVVFINLLMACFNLIKALCMHHLFLDMELLVASTLTIYFGINTLFLYGIFKGEARTKSSIVKVISIIQILILVIIAVTSKQYWYWGTVAFLVASYSFTTYLSLYKAIAQIKEESLVKTKLRINEDIDAMQALRSKKIKKNIGYTILALILGLIIAYSEIFGCMLVTIGILFIAPLVYIYKLGNAINEPKGMLYISYFIPLVGMILYLIYVRNVKALGNACGKAALLGLLMPVIATVILIVLYIGAYATMPIPYYIPIFTI